MQIDHKIILIQIFQSSFFFRSISFSSSIIAFSWSSRINHFARRPRHHDRTFPIASCCYTAQVLSTTAIAIWLPHLMVDLLLPICAVVYLIAVCFSQLSPVDHECGTHLSLNWIGRLTAIAAKRHSRQHFGLLFGLEWSCWFMGIGLTFLTNHPHEVVNHHTSSWGWLGWAALIDEFEFGSSFSPKCVEKFLIWSQLGKGVKPTLAPMSIHCPPQGCRGAISQKVCQSIAGRSMKREEKFLRPISSWSLHAMDDDCDENMNWNDCEFSGMMLLQWRP